MLEMVQECILDLSQFSLTKFVTNIYPNRAAEFRLPFYKKAITLSVCLFL